METTIPSEDFQANMELRMGLIEDRFSDMEARYELIREKIGEKLKVVVDFLYGVLVGLLIAAAILL